jgi:hypothetical protein
MEASDLSPEFSRLAAILTDIPNHVCISFFLTMPCKRLTSSTNQKRAPKTAVTVSSASTEPTIAHTESTTAHTETPTLALPLYATTDETAYQAKRAKSAVEDTTKETVDKPTPPPTPQAEAPAPSTTTSSDAIVTVGTTSMQNQAAQDTPKKPKVFKRTQNKTPATGMKHTFLTTI